ncbi:MAG: hypothetical protein ACXWBN_17380 [Acidimicrobiales bacterium]
MTRYVVDPELSSVTTTARPAVGGPGTPVALSVTGTVDILDDVPSGTITVTFDGETPSVAEFDLAGTRTESAPGHEQGPSDGAFVLRGRTSRPAGAFGLTGPPLLNPTILISWRLVLAPA